MRLFIAVNIPAQVKDRIGDIQHGLIQSQADVKWVEKDNLHLTLRFIGDTLDDKPLLIAAALEPKLKGFGSFEIVLSGMGAFPDMNFPRIIWAGVEDMSGKLRELVLIIEESLLKLGFEGEAREFTPHLTIGRVRWQKSISNLKAVIQQKSEYDPVPFQISSVDIMESVLTPQGPIYKCLNSIIV